MCSAHKEVEKQGAKSRLQVEDLLMIRGQCTLLFMDPSKLLPSMSIIMTLSQEYSGSNSAEHCKDVNAVRHLSQCCQAPIHIR